METSVPFYRDVLGTQIAGRAAPNSQTLSLRFSNLPFRRLIVGEISAIGAHKPDLPAVEGQIQSANEHTCYR
jgi:hypothetical protein